MLSLADGESNKQLSFSAREPERESNAASATAWGFGTPSPATMETKGSRRTTSILHEEHAISERKRRGKMQLQFATLASIIPDISKGLSIWVFNCSQTDKVSLLGSTIDYVHHLRGKLKTLQEERYQSTGGNNTAESPPLDAWCRIGDDDDDEASPTIEVNVRGTTVLLRVVCQDKKGMLIMVLKELEKHGLSIISTNVLPLADTSSLNITVTAQVNHIYL
ncbi:hypothetical protein HU200_042067 [Digitaria exilis]|uniref:BHLH domain-containing protein n=1 Tax=Digitaria exilis TaxID=1010633 RepID=A0A835B6U0_9POAL|nr:hypothetical protein HU200_042067 [Digitaria exilis]